MIRAISITRSSYETTWGDRLEAATESAAAYVEAVQRPLRQALSRPDTTVSIHDIMPDIASHLDGARALARFAVLNRQARELAANNDEYRRAGVVQKLLRYAEQEHPER